MHREDLVVSVARQQSLVGTGQLQPEKERWHATPQEEEHGGGAVHDADLLVIDGGEPVLQADRLARTRKRAHRVGGFSGAFTRWQGKGFFNDCHISNS